MARAAIMLVLLALITALSKAGERAVIEPTAAGKDVPLLYRDMGRFCDVPSKLLYAVALGESGRFVNGSVRPWPWTLNIDGTGQYFETREAQFESLMAAISAGRTVDVGLMQLNWRWKFELLHSPWMATNPMFNLNVACRIIRGHYDTNPNAGWFAAIGRYHREADRPQDIKARQRYVARIRRAWARL